MGKHFNTFRMLVSRQIIDKSTFCVVTVHVPVQTCVKLVPCSLLSVHVALGELNW